MRALIALLFSFTFVNYSQSANAPADGYFYAPLYGNTINYYESAHEACVDAKRFRERYWNASNGFYIEHGKWTGTGATGYLDNTPVWYNSYGRAGQCNLRRMSGHWLWQPTGYAGQSDIALDARAANCQKYPSNSTQGCGKTVNDLMSIIKNPTDPTRIFHRTQQCIALKSCDLRCTTDNCDWLNRVIPDFVNPYLQKKNKWTSIEADCYANASGLLGDALCANNMAFNHIFQDLIPALEKSGCGSSADWEKVFSVIETCTSDVLANVTPVGVASLLGSKGAQAYRTAARTACQASRKFAGLNVEIDNNLKGKVCKP
jgi:hypothetical protein